MAKKSLFLLLLAILLSSCDPYPLCEQVGSTGHLINKYETDAYYTTESIPITTCFGSGKSRFCTTTNNISTTYHPPTYHFIIDRNSKTYERSVDSKTYYSIEKDSWISFNICKSDLGD